MLWASLDPAPHLERAPRAEVLLSLLLPLFLGWDKPGQPSWRKQPAPGPAPTASARPELLPQRGQGTQS